MSRHVPERSCIVCSSKKEKRYLQRMVRLPQGGVVADVTGEMPGRGAYLCGSEDCWEVAVSDHRVARALRLERDSRLAQEVRAAKDTFLCNESVAVTKEDENT